MRKFFCFVVFAVAVLMQMSCQETLDERAYRQAKEYTKRYCPTPVINYSRTDSVVFDRQKKVYVYYISFFDDLDNQEVIDLNKSKITNMLIQSVRESTGLKSFLEAGYRFEYVCHSGSCPEVILLQVKV